MYIRPVKGIAIILLTLLLGVFLLTCAPSVDGVNIAEEEAPYYYKIVFDGNIKEGDASIVKYCEGHVHVTDIDGNEYVTGWNNVLIIEK